MKDWHRLQARNPPRIDDHQLMGCIDPGTPRPSRSSHKSCPTYQIAAISTETM